jgi:hypothetical protein
MRKSDKKTEKALIGALKDACEIFLGEVAGFQWLTHFANYAHFPASLSIVCVFDSNDNLARMCQQDAGDAMTQLLQEKLKMIGIEVSDISAHVDFDTEEACHAEHNGKWNERFK